MQYPATRDSNPVGVGQLTGAEIDLSFDPRAAGIGQAIINACQRIRLSDGSTLDHDLAAGESHLETGGGTSAIFLDKHNIGGVGALNSDPYNTAHAYPNMQAGADEYVAHLVAYNDVNPTDLVKQLDGRYKAALAEVAGFPGIVQKDGGHLWAYEQRYAHTYPESKYQETPLDKRYGAKAAARANVIWEKARGTVGGIVTIRDPRFVWRPDLTEFGYPKGSHGRGGRSVDLFILHITQGTDSSSTLLGNNGSSSHYLTWRDGTPREQNVDEGDAAWTPGNGVWAMRSLNLEVEMRSVNDWTPAIMREVAKTAAPMLLRWNIPPVYLGKTTSTTARGMIGHRDVPDGSGGWGGSSHHDDPGAHFDWPAFCAMMVEELAALGTGGGTTVPRPTGADPVTGKWIAEEFVDFYVTRGGIDVFGRPISGAFMEDSKNDDGSTTSRLTQYFERSVFQRFPENAGTIYEVQLRLLGTEELAGRYPTGAPA